MSVIVHGLGAVPVALPLSPGACLALAATVLAVSAGDSDRMEPLAAAAADDPALAVWLGGEQSTGDAWLESLRRDLVGIAGPKATRLGASAPPREAWEALAAALRPRGVGKDDLAREWGRQLRARIAAGALAALPSEPPAETPSIEGVVLGRALDLAARHARSAVGMEAAVAAARLEGLRALAYGAGHEINNPLANIAARGQALLADEADPRRRRRLATIVDQAFRARDMIGALMLFARPPQPRLAVCDLSAVVAAAIKAVSARALERGVTFRTAASGEMIAWADRTLLEEALRAVLLNAIDAMPGGGRVAITVDRKPTPDSAAVTITVDDEGPGMDADTRRAALDPFFSGRDAGRGIGFGLTKAGRFLAECGGQLMLDDAPGGGTRVALRVAAPASAGPAAQSPQTTPSEGLDSG